ncbi:helix-turn-helix domain-containing protein [Streptomyces sp. NPDC057253]|uniref:helix-turn-helix domain-containing protein n=1 Tax=Streptomyces sp. NPDC057253 TaxID=3346069 RepID=UPI0036454D6A
MNSADIPPGFYGTSDVARALGIKPASVRLLVHRGQLKRTAGTERHPLYAATDVAALLAKRRERAAA